MKQVIFRTAHSTEERRNEIKAVFGNIAARANVRVTDSLGRTYPPSPRALVEWLTDNADLVIALIHATRADPDGARCALVEIGAGETEAELAAQDAAEEHYANND